MGANAQIAVPSFTAGQILTAAQQTQINTGIPVFATTVTRDAAFGGTGEKVLAQGQTCYIEATSTYQTYNGSAWVSLVTGGLTLVKTQTIGTSVTSVEVTSAFSSTYNNYLITISGGVAAASVNLSLKLGATTTLYFNAGQVINYAGTSATIFNNNGANFTSAGVGTTDSINASIHLFGPNLAKNTQFTSSYIFGNPATNDGEFASVGGYQRSTTQFTDFTIISAQALTGGTIRVYGYQNS